MPDTFNDLERDDLQDNMSEIVNALENLELAVERVEEAVK
jgi:hypothetical protein